MIPGEIITEAGDVELNTGRKTITLTVANTGDRPIQVGSHFHFYEVNSALHFERSQSRGYRLNITAGTAVRFEPGEEKEVVLVIFGGKRMVHGFNNLVNGDTTGEANKQKATQKLSAQNFKNKTS